MGILFLLLSQWTFADYETFTVEAPITVRAILEGDDFLTTVAELPVDSIVSVDLEKQVDQMKYLDDAGQVRLSKNNWFHQIKVIEHASGESLEEINQKNLHLSVTHRLDLGREADNIAGEEIPLKPFPAPETRGRKHRLWATYYHTPLYRAGGGDHVLKDMDDNPLLFEEQPAALSHEQKCNAGMQGSVRIIFADDRAQTFNFAGVKAPEVIDCRRYFGNRFRDTGKVRFREANSSWGDGVRDYSLIPFRTIAVNPDKIPYGTIVYVPEAVGTRIKLPNGEIFVHDGYFFAGDTGGAMRADARHIDFFVGNKNRQTFPFITSNSSGKFDAFVINDEEVKEHLTEIHLERY